MQTETGELKDNAPTGKGKPVKKTEPAVITPEFATLLRKTASNYKAKPVKAVQVPGPFTLGVFTFDTGAYLVFDDKGGMAGMNQSDFETTFQEVKRVRTPK